MANPGMASSQIPRDNELVRRIEDLQHYVRELEPSIARSFSGTVKRLDDAIASVIVPTFNQGGINNYPISTTSTDRFSVSFTVPEGYTRAMVLATASAMGQNASGVGDYLYVQANVAGVNGGELFSYAADGTAVGLSAMLYWALYGLVAGESFDVSVKTRTSNNPWPAAPGNQANIYALVMFTR